MTDRVYPSAKPKGAPTNGAAAAPQPAAKPNLYNPTRPHPYRPQPNHHHRRPRSRRSCVCLCCFWSLLLLAVLLLLAAIVGCAVYVLYSPRRPTFSVAALRISRFNLSTNADDTTRLTAALNLTISAKNPNKKIIYTYDPISITALSNQVLIANGSFPFFTSDPQNTTIIRSSLSITSELVDADLVKGLRSDLKRKNGLDLKILMDTKVVVKMEKLKSKKLGIRVTCNGIHGTVPKGKSPSIGSITDAKCKVDLRIKIWKWTF